MWNNKCDVTSRRADSARKLGSGRAVILGQGDTEVGGLAGEIAVEGFAC